MSDGSIIHGYQYSIEINKKLCLWHVDSAWRGALKFIGDNEQKCQICTEMHKTLRIIVDTTVVT